MRRMYALGVLLACLFIYNVADAAPLSFTKGEKLTYDVKYKGMKLGRSVLTFYGEKDLGSQTSYYITFFTKTAALKDAEEIYGDKDTFLPMEVHRKIKKKVGFTDNIIEKYDQENYRVDIRSKSRLRTKEFSIEKDSPIHNAILLVYYCRALESFNKDKPIKINLPTRELDVIYKGIHAVDTPIGEFHAHSFTSNPPKFELWLSADEKRVPLKIKDPGMLGYSLVIESID